MCFLVILCPVCAIGNVELYVCRMADFMLFASCKYRLFVKEVKMKLDPLLYGILKY